ncbi:TPA: hypothetical protein N0F65_007025 [Lagenidium giganteum]|uniref:Uncharacterized protein n=1 Tax=Lagenidium giganteum TaxID=4803 RepID=A0AAV2YZ33_9STRA|nr:TPA: hypothetical protein N0F65_007025 [Lagenidium giganteum]
MLPMEFVPLLPLKRRLSSSRRAQPEFKGDPSEGWTPLHRAAAEGRLDLLQVFAQHGVALDMRATGTDETALHVAAATGHVAVVEWLLSMGADAEARDFRAYTALLHAVEHAHVAVVETLLKHRVNTNAWRSVDQATCLHLAAQCGHSQLINVLVDAGVEVDLQNLQGATPLHFAARAGQLDAALALLELHANVNAQDDRGRSVLYMAVDYEDTTQVPEKTELARIELLRLLLTHGAEIRGRHRKGRSSALRCAAKRGRFQIVKFLLGQGAKSNKVSAMVFATFWAQSSDVVKHLMSPIPDSSRRLLKDPTTGA